MANNKRSTRKSVAVALGIVGIAGLSMASAAQLTITSAEVSAGTQIVASCDTDGVSVAYTTSFDNTAPTAAYKVTAVTVSGIAAGCNGDTIDVTLLEGTGTAAAFDGTDTVLASKSGSISGTSVTLTLTSAVSAAKVEGIAISIS